MSSLKELQELIHEKFGIEVTELDPYTPMRDKGLDSLALAEFLFEVEDRFHVTLPDPDPEVDTLAKLAAWVDKARTATPSPRPSQQSAT